MYPPLDILNTDILNTNILNTNIPNTNILNNIEVKDEASNPINGNAQNHNNGQTLLA